MFIVRNISKNIYFYFGTFITTLSKKYLLKKIYKIF